MQITKEISGLWIKLGNGKSIALQRWFQCFSLKIWNQNFSIASAFEDIAFFQIKHFWRFGSGLKRLKHSRVWKCQATAKESRIAMEAAVYPQRESFRPTENSTHSNAYSMVEGATWERKFSYYRVREHVSRNLCKIAAKKSTGAKKVPALNLLLLTETAFAKVARSKSRTNAPLTLNAPDRAAACVSSRCCKCDRRKGCCEMRSSREHSLWSGEEPTPGLARTARAGYLQRTVIYQQCRWQKKTAIFGQSKSCIEACALRQCCLGQFSACGPLLVMIFCVEPTLEILR